MTTIIQGSVDNSFTCLYSAHLLSLHVLGNTPSWFTVDIGFQMWHSGSNKRKKDVPSQRFILHGSTGCMQAQFLLSPSNNLFQFKSSLAHISAKHTVCSISVPPKQHVSTEGLMQMWKQMCYSRNSLHTQTDTTDCN